MACSDLSPNLSAGVSSSDLSASTSQRSLIDDIAISPLSLFIPGDADTWPWLCHWLCFCLALAFEVTNPSTHQLLDPVLVRDKPIFWNSAGQIAETAVIYSILWLVLSWKPPPWLASRQHLLTVGLALLFLTFAYLCLFRLELLVGSIDYDLGSKLSLVQLTALGRCWASFGGLIQLPSMSWLLLTCFQSSSSLQQQQARWLLLALFIPMILPFFFFLPAQPQSVAISYVGPWLLASMPFLMAWGLFRTGLLAHLPYYQSIVFQRMPTAGIALDNQQRILVLNPVAEQLFQISPDKVEGQTLDQAFPLLDHPTKPLMLNHQPYSCVILNYLTEVTNPLDT